MSLLMKALDKATQDRDKAPAANAAATAGQAERELTLEAVEPRRDGPSAAHHTRMGPSGGASTSSASGASSARNSAQVQAANVLASSWQPRGTSPFAWLQANPLYAFGLIAGLFLAAYGAYVYVQIAHPAWLIKTPPGTLPAVATAPAAPAAAPSVAPSAPDPIPATPAPNTEAPAPVAADGSSSQVVPMSSVFGRGSKFAPPPAPDLVDARKPAARREALQPPAPPQIAAPRIAATPDGPSRTPPAVLRDKIAISRSDQLAPRVNPAVNEAYAAFQAGHFDAAQRLYRQALTSEPSNVDALLGLAAIAQHQNRPEEAHRYYSAILDAEPRHALAQSGLIALMSRADPQASESRLKQLIAREPSAPLYFNLGNVYAEQGLWAQAQQAYFQAHHLEPRNPDYAYNLAIGLEHLGQSKLALDFYRKALQLAPSASAANFDVARAQERITQLAARAN